MGSTKMSNIFTLGVLEAENLQKQKGQEYCNIATEERDYN